MHLRIVAAACILSAFSGARAQAPASSGNFEGEIAAFEKKDAAAQPPSGEILFVGSSSIRLWGDLETVFLPKQVINRGFGGSQIRDSTLYAERIILPYKPRIVVLYAGDNDIAVGRSPEQVLSDYRQFVDKIRGTLPDCKMAFISIKPSPSRWALVDKAREANRLVKSYIRKQKRMSYIDVFDAMLGEDGQPRPEFYRPDKLHPTPAAYALWRKIIAPYLR